MKVTVEEVKPTPPPKKVLVEFTEEEAKLLQCLCGRGVDWYDSGDIGRLARELHAQFVRAGISHDYTYELSGGDMPTWRKR